ncbi:hypothetical protein HYV50_00600 [Candidatus Pacearchaeota archaeon]|nr:hypothetical protein [Candidatus Pacearchaeota archaeon]
MEEKKQEEIKKQAREILDKFSKTLAKVEFKEKKIEREKEAGGFREEGEGKEVDPDFRKRFFENAPKTEGDFIIAEKKKW